MEKRWILVKNRKKRVEKESTKEIYKKKELKSIERKKKETPGCWCPRERGKTIDKESIENLKKYEEKKKRSKEIQKKS